MQVGGVLAGGFQSILREWADYAQTAARRNVDGVNSLMRARTPQDLASAQSDLLVSEIQLLLDSSIKISEATAHLARDPLKPSMVVLGRPSGADRHSV